MSYGKSELPLHSVFNALELISRELVNSLLFMGMCTSLRATLYNRQHLSNCRQLGLNLTNVLQMHLSDDSHLKYVDTNLMKSNNGDCIELGDRIKMEESRCTYTLYTILLKFKY